MSSGTYTYILGDVTMGDIGGLPFKQKIRVLSGFYAGRKGRVIFEGEQKYLVRFRVGVFSHVDAWLYPAEFELL